MNNQIKTVKIMQLTLQQDTENIDLLLELRRFISYMRKQQNGAHKYFIIAT